MNGYDVAKNLAAEPLTTHIPIIILTCMVSLDLQKTVPETKAIGYLVKPVEHSSLLKAINLALEKNKFQEGKS